VFLVLLSFACQYSCSTTALPPSPSIAPLTVTIFGNSTTIIIALCPAGRGVFWVACSHYFLCNDITKMLVQAILPLRGKILNIERKDEAAMYKNEEIQNLILGLGLGVKVNLFFCYLYLHIFLSSSTNRNLEKKRIFFYFP
jgi:hypothetical protein